MRISEEEKEMWLADWRDSGKSAWAYAKENGLNQQTFVRWTKAENEQRFVEVPLQVIHPPVQAPEILIERGDVKIHIPLCLSRTDMRTVMEALGGAL